MKLLNKRERKDKCAFKIFDKIGSWKMTVKAVEVMRKEEEETVNEEEEMERQEEKRE